MTSHEHILWHHMKQLFIPFSIFHLIIQMERKTEENDALQTCACLICRINETSCFSRKPQEKCPKFEVVAFAC